MINQMTINGVKIMKFIIAIEPGDEDHSFGVVVPDLPGCFSAGDTLMRPLKTLKKR